VGPRIAQAEPVKKAEPLRVVDAKIADAKPKAPAVPAPVHAGQASEQCRRAVSNKHAKEITATCTAAFAEDATDAEAAVALARLEFDRGRFPQAYVWSKKAIAVDPDVADAYAFAGAAEQNQGHGKAAKEAYMRYLQLAPSGRYAADIRSIVGSL
jgi:tetratricopeptide (TPR) repeat protein